MQIHFTLVQLCDSVYLIFDGRVQYEIEEVQQEIARVKHEIDEVQ